MSIMCHQNNCIWKKNMILAAFLNVFLFCMLILNLCNSHFSFSAQLWGLETYSCVFNENWNYFAVTWLQELGFKEKYQLSLELLSLVAIYGNKEKHLPNLDPFACSGVGALLCSQATIGESTGSLATLKPGTQESSGLESSPAAISVNFGVGKEKAPWHTFVTKGRI